MKKLTAMSVALCGVLAASAPVRGEYGAGGQCWPPEALAGRPDERIIRRVPYDRASEPQGDPVTLAPVPANMRGSIRSVKLPPGAKFVALTFDLCENGGEISGYDAEIFDTLRRLHVKATFFPSGKWLADHPVRAAQILADPLFQAGGHSWTHRNFRLLTPAEVKEDLALDLKADAAARRNLQAMACYRRSAGDAADTDHASLFRFPFGTCNADSLHAVNEAGLLAIQWDVVSGDPAPAQTAEAIRRGVVAAAKPGSIIIMHANGRGWHTAEALPLVISDLRQRGFEFATVGELLQMGAPVIADSCYEVKPGDNARYDKLFPVERRPVTAAGPLVPKPE